MVQDTAISIRQVAKRFGDFTALHEVSLDIRQGEFFTLLGPSGCGKTTLLRLLGGFEPASGGQIRLFGQEIERLPANRRPINTVFQQYALFPHMSIHENVQFGMRMQGIGRREREARASEMLQRVQLERFAQRRPGELSGGQQQRVALARALAPRPKVLLLDEPLSALDLKLRQAMRLELKQLQEDMAITFVFVTHDQEEALTLSDRIAVMSAGEIQQVGSPREIYEEPANRFVADFIGETNLLQVSVQQSGTDGWLHCQLANGGEAQPLRCPVAPGIRPGQSAWLSIRPERLSLSAPDATGAGLDGVIRQSIYMGTDTQYVVALADGQTLVARLQNGGEAPWSRGAAVRVGLDQQAARLLGA
nr:ABC transporter ATP-binding protein [Stutzerimonas kirkiae]